MQRLIQKASITGERRHNTVTFNPSTAKMGEKVYVTVPKLDPQMCIVPGSINLLYTLKNSNDKSWPLNNVNRLMVQGLEVKVGRETVYNNTGESVYRLYEDLWLPAEKRDLLISHGIAPEEVRKHLGGSSDASTSSKTGGVLDSQLGKNLYKTQRISLGHILNDHGLFAPSKANFEVKYTITLPNNSTNIGDAQSSQTVGNFSLEDLQLEYDTVKNEEVANDIENKYQSGKNLVMSHLSLESVSEWDKDATSINENLHLHRESLKLVVMLFKWVDQKMDENFIYPNITEASASVNGKPNAIHSTSMKPPDMKKEALRVFCEPPNKIEPGKFFNNQFALVFDFRSLEDKNLYNDGVKVSGTSGIQINVKRTATSKNVKCHIFVVSDAIHQIDNNGFQKTII